MEQSSRVRDGRSEARRGERAYPRARRMRDVPDQRERSGGTGAGWGGGTEVAVAGGRGREDERSQATEIEAAPLSLGLRQAVGDDVDGEGIVAEPAVAAGDADVLRGGVLVRVDAGLPVRDAVAGRVDRGRGDRGRLAHPAQELGVEV